MTTPDSAQGASAFLAVVAALVLDNGLRLEEAVGWVTDLVMASGGPSREMVVALQSFDRLKQEYEALGDALSRYAEAMNELQATGEEHTKLGQNIIMAINVADLKDRLLRRLHDDLPNAASPPIADPTAAQVDVDIDVVF